MRQVVLQLLEIKWLPQIKWFLISGISFTQVTVKLSPYLRNKYPVTVPLVVERPGIGRGLPLGP